MVGRQERCKERARKRDGAGGDSSVVRAPDS